MNGREPPANGFLADLDGTTEEEKQDIVKFIDKTAITLIGSFPRHHRQTIELDAVDDDNTGIISQDGIAKCCTAADHAPAVYTTACTSLATKEHCLLDTMTSGYCMWSECAPPPLSV